MEIRDRRYLLEMFKALADEQRLKMVGWLCRGEYKAHELAELAGISAPTISHHLGKLRLVGLVQLRDAGPEKFYRINRAALDEFKQFVGQIDQMALDLGTKDESWLDALPLNEADRKVLANYTLNGYLTRIPSKEKNLMVVLRWLATLFQPAVRYSEPEVNAILTKVHSDYATLRRDLVDFGFLRRERAGTQYWLTPDDETA
jgi:hypothetical protein